MSDLSEDDRAAAEGALLMLLDDASPLVRRAMAETFAREADAPPAIVAALAADQPSVALPILEHSPLLLDADLVDMVATGNCETQCAIARRFDLPSSVAAAIAEVGSPSSTLELIENPDAQLAAFSLTRIVERHGHLAAIRESVLEMDDLPAAIRLTLAEKVSNTLMQFVTTRSWLSAGRAQRIAAEALERSTVNIAAGTRGEDMAALVSHLRAAGQLNAGLILRTLLSGNIDLFEESLVELSGLQRNRVSAIAHDRGGASLTALLAKAGLPESTFPAFRAALDATHEIGFVGTVAGATRLRRRMVERVLTRCETSPDVAEPLLILLRRFATESAREEVRLFCDDLVATAFSDELTAHAVAEDFIADERMDDYLPEEFDAFEPDAYHNDDDRVSADETLEAYDAHGSYDEPLAYDDYEQPEDHYDDDQRSYAAYEHDDRRLIAA